MLFLRTEVLRYPTKRLRDYGILAFFLAIRLETDFDKKKSMNANIMKTRIFH